MREGFQNSLATELLSSQDMTLSEVPQFRAGLTAQLIESFTDLLKRGVLHWGTRLPPERELAKQFGVSRVSLRHALKALELFGIITQRVGDGTYLSQDASKVLESALDFLLLIDDISPLEVVDTRLMIEPELAASAARNARGDNVEEIAFILESMREEHNEEKLTVLDLAFHDAICRVSENRLARRIFAILHRSTASSIRLTSKLGDWNQTIALHTSIYVAIRDRKEEDARKSMSRHLRAARDLLLTSEVKQHENNISNIPSLTSGHRS